MRRYSGLREEDFIDVVDSLTAQFRTEIGPARDRPANALHEEWVHSSGGVIRGIKTTKSGKPWVNENAMSIMCCLLRLNMCLSYQNSPRAITSGSTAADKEVVQLKFLQKSNEEQMKKLFDLIRTEPLVIHHYLEKAIFLNYTRNQRVRSSRYT